jgi:hypothetical protein
MIVVAMRRHPRDLPQRGKIIERGAATPSRSDAEFGF